MLLSVAEGQGGSIRVRGEEREKEMTKSGYGGPTADGPAVCTQ